MSGNPEKMSGPGWTVYPRDNDRLELRYYENGKRLKHWIPPTIRKVEIKKYVEAFLKARREQDGSSGESSIRPDGTINPRITFKEFADLWTNGNLTTMFPNRIRMKKSAGSDASRLKIHAFPIIGDIQVRAFVGERGVDLAESVVRKITKKGTARQVAQAISRILTMAAFRGIRLMQHSPLPKGFVPSNPKDKAKSYLYPVEDAQLLANTNIDLHVRLYFGFSVREGGRLGNFLYLRWSQLDLVNGIITLDETKTGTSLSWVLDPGVVAALTRYRKLKKAEGSQGYVFLNEDKELVSGGKVINRTKASDLLRECLTVSDVSRSQLFEQNEHRLRLRAHDLRGSFVTVKLGLGKSETWVMDRTGHTTSQMLNKYRRAARQHAEANLGDYLPLDEAIPELREPGASSEA